MAGIFPSIGGSQNVDANGRPLAFATLSVFNSGTTQLSSCFQDIGLAIAAQNPMTADITGRLPLFYVADGVYKVQLVDASGTPVYTYPQVASIGASATGGGGAAVDPTTVFSTGDELWKKVGGIRSGWVRQNALTIGSATSGGTERANADCQNLFLYLWANYTNAQCPVIGGRGVSAAADWAANKQITLPDMRGRGATGVDAMGNVRANVLPDGNVSGGLTGDTAGAIGGEANHALVLGELAVHNHAFTGTAAAPTGTFNGIAGTPTGSFTGNAPGNAGLNSSGIVQWNGGGAFGGSVSETAAGPNVVAASIGGGGFNQITPNTTIPTPTGSIAMNAFTPAGTIAMNNFTPAGSIGNTGSGTAHNTMPPFALGTWYMKL